MDILDDSVDAVGSILRRGFGTPPAALPIAVWCSEISSWLTVGRLSSLKQECRRLRDEHDAAIAAVPSRLRRQIRSPLIRFDAAIADALVKKPSTAAIGSARDAAVSLAEVLRRPAAREAAWDDVVATATTARSLGNARGAAEQLRCMIDVAGFDVDRRMRMLIGILGDDRSDIVSAQVQLGRRRPPRHWPSVDARAKLSARARLQLCRDLTALAADTTECIVWLAYRRALLSHDVIDHGSVTFVRLECAHRSINETGALLGTKFDDTNAPPPPVVDDDIAVVRVQLDRHLTRDAIADAEAIVAAVTSDVAADTIGIAWEQLGWVRATFASGGEVTRSYTTAAQVADIRRSYDHERAAQHLDRRAAPVLTALGRQRPFDRLLADALRIRAEASLLPNVRTQVILLSSAAEAAAASAGFDLDDIRTFIAGEWPWVVIKDEMRRSALLAVGRDDLFADRRLRELDAKLFSDDRPTWSYVLHLDAVVEHRRQLFSIGEDVVERRNNRDLVKLLTDPKAYLARVEVLGADGKLRFDRARRARNAIAHGNPIAITALAAARKSWDFVAEVAVFVATDGDGRGGDGHALVARMAASRSALQAELESGTRPIDAFELVDR